jgi:hypothetical protein
VTTNRTRLPPDAMRLPAQHCAFSHFKAVKARCARTLSRSKRDGLNDTIGHGRVQKTRTVMVSGTGPRLAVRSRVKSTEPAKSSARPARNVGPAVRGQWAIESACTGRAMVMLSRDDDVHLQRSRTRQLHHPQITSPITHPPGARKDSLRLKT